MRSPVNDRERDLVAVAPDGRVAAFMVWWSDPSGIAQIEPFGTHPDFHRQGVGRALLKFGLARMQAAGMRTVRVCTEESREAAVAFYGSAGFEQGPRLGWCGALKQLGARWRADVGSRRRRSSAVVKLTKLAITPLFGPHPS
jgi:GNAT superfamily N-acetyltransferase